MKEYSQREFLKMIGLSIAFLPFAGCFHSADKDDAAEDDSVPASLKDHDTKKPGMIRVTDDDVILLTRDEAAYAKFNRAFNKRVHHLPKYIAVCKTEKGIQLAVQRARDENLKVAVKSGGHSFEGFSSNDGGL